LSLSFSPRTDAATSSTVNFQARLESSAGNIAANGTYNVEFKLYNAATSTYTDDQGACTMYNGSYHVSDPACLWTEDYLVSASSGVQVVNGYLTANLGSITAFPSNMNWNQQLWLTMRIGSTGSSPTWDTEMSPRLLLTATPYSFQAGQLSATNSGYVGTLSFASTLTGADSIIIPNTGGAGGTVCLQSSGTCGFLTGSGTGVQLQGSSPGSVQTGNFNVSGTGIAGVLQAGTFDTPTSETLSLGSTNANAITIGNSTNNIATTINGTVIIKPTPSHDSTTAFQVQNSTSSALLTGDTTNMRLGVDVTYSQMAVPSGLTLGTTSGGSLTATTAYYYKITAIDSLGGETTASTTQCIATTSTNETITLYWTAVTGASGYKIYRINSGSSCGTDPGGEVYLTTVLSNYSSGSPYSDNGSITPGTATPSTNNSAYVSTNVSSNNGQLTIGGNGTPTGQLYVSGTVPSTSLSFATTNLNGPSSVFVSGSYAYLTSSTNNELVIYDVSNSANPTFVGMSNTNLNNPDSVYVQGHYAYVASYANSQLVIFDISNPSAPNYVGKTNINLYNPVSVYVQGRYAYVVNGSFNYTAINEFATFDISNPANPIPLGTNNNIILGVGTSLSVSGNYAYAVGSDGLVSYNISNPANPTYTGWGNASHPSSVYAQGRYAYVTDTTNNKLDVFDVSNPSIMTMVGSSNTNLSNPSSVYVQGRYAYVGNSGNNPSELVVFDVSDPTNPTYIGMVSSNLWNAKSIFVQGRYAYVGSYQNGKLVIFDLGGAYIQQLQTGGTETGTLTVDTNAQVYGDESVQGGLSVGASIQSTGNLGISGGAAIQGSTILSGGSNSLATPSTPTITAEGGTGSASYYYTVTAVNAYGGETTASPAGFDSNGYAALTYTYYNQINWSAVTGASGYKIYRTQVTSGSPTSTGLIGSTSGTTFDDYGLAASGSSPTTNSTGQLTVLGSSTFATPTNSTTAFQVQNAAGNSVLAVNTTGNQVLLGTTGASGSNGQLVFNSATAGNYAVTLNVSSSTSASYALTLPTTEASTGQCLQAGTVSGASVPLVFGSCVDNNASITEVAEWDAHGTSSTITTLADSPSYAGDLLVLTVQLPGTGVSVATVSGGGVTTGGWSKVNANSGDGTVNRVEMWIGKVTTTGAGTITLTYNGTVGATNEITATEFTANGISINTAWGVDNSGVLLNSSSNTVTYPSLTSAGPSELYMGYAQTKNAGSIGSSPGFTYTLTGQNNVLTYISPTLAGTPYQPTANEATAGESNTVAALITAFVSSTAINNSISLQQANFNVQAASSGSVAGVLQAASSGTGDILDLRNSGGTAVATFGSTGNVLLQASTNSTTAFQVQNASGSGLLTVDTANGNIVLGTDGTPAALTIRGGIATGGNITGSNITFAASNGTGTGNSGSFIFQTASGSSTTSSPPVLDSTSNGYQSSSPVTWNHTVGSSLTNSILIVGLAVQEYCTYTSVTYNSVALTQLSTLNSPNIYYSGAHTEIWYLLSPTSGTHQISATISSACSSDAGAGGAASYSNVSQSAPFGTVVTGAGTTSNGGHSTLSVTGTNTSQIIIDAVSLDNQSDANTTPFAAGGSQTQRWQNDDTWFGNSPSTAGSSIPGGGTVTFTWGTSPYGSDYADIAVPLNSSASASTDTLTTRLSINPSGPAVQVTGLLSTSSETVNDSALIQDAGAGTALTVTNPSGEPLVTARANNLLLNGDFESNTTGWAASGTGAAIAQNINPPYVYSGAASLAITIGSTTNTGADVTAFNSGNSSNALPAGTYVLSFYAKAAGTFSNLAAAFSNTIGTNACTLNSNSVSTSAFALYSCTYTAASAVSAISIGSSTANAPNLYIDAVSVVSAATNNLVANPGFETGTTGWSNYGSAATIAWNQNLAYTYDGQTSLVVTSGATANGGAQDSTYIAAQPSGGGTYTLSFYAMGVSSFSTLGASLGSGTCNLNSASVGTSGFTEYYCTATTTSSPTIKIYNTASSSVVFYLDAVQLTLSSGVQPYNIGQIQMRGIITNPVDLQSVTNSTTAFQIQNAAGTSLLAADTTNMQVIIGNTTNGVAISTSGGITAYGTARHTNKIILTPEYAGAVLDNGGASSDIGTMTAGYDSTQKENYYQWTTAQSTNQTYDIVIQIPIPSNFSSALPFATNDPLTVDINTSDTTNGTVVGTLLDTSGTAVTNWNTCSLTPTVTGWITSGAGATYGATCNITTGTWTAGGVATLRLHIQAPPSGTTKVGDIVLTYISAY